MLCAGEKLHRCRTRFLRETIPSDNALVLGEGNGRFLCDFLRLNSLGRVTCVDSSARMIDRARRRLKCAGLSENRVSFIHENALTWRSRAVEYDLIVTHFFLDCFPPAELEALIRAIARSATPHAKWLIADFREPVAGWRRARAQCLLRLMYLFFRYVTGLPAKTLTNPDSLLVSAGFALKERLVSEWGLLHSDLWMSNESGPHSRDFMEGT